MGYLDTMYGMVEKCKLMAKIALEEALVSRPKVSRPNSPSLDACAPACRTTTRAPWDRLNVDVYHVAALYDLP